MIKGLITVCSECQTPTELREINIEFERKGVQATMSGVPAMVCPECGEEYVPGEIAGVVVRAVSRTIDETVDLLKYTHTLHQQLSPFKQAEVRESLQLSLV